MRKLNCWEYTNCCREANGRASKGTCCPTTRTRALHGIHGGMQGGRSCWVVEGTLCGGRKNGAYAEKFIVCRTCNFYRMVMQEEGTDFLLSAALLERLRSAGGADSRDDCGDARAA